MGERQFLNLSLDRLDHFRVSMPQAGNRGTSGAVEIALAGGIEEIAALSAKDERRHAFRVPGKYVRHVRPYPLGS